MAETSPKYHFYWQRFLQSTTTHGIWHLFQSSTPTWKCVWSFAIFLTTSLCVWSTTSNVLDYLRYDVKTKITSVQLDNIQFPCITFCPSHALLKSAASQSRVVLLLSALVKAKDTVAAQILFEKVSLTLGYCTKNIKKMF